MADNQHKDPTLGMSRIEWATNNACEIKNCEVHRMETFILECGICKKFQKFHADQPNAAAKLHALWGEAGWQWIYDGTEDGIQLCSTTCRTFWELSR